MTKQTNRNEKWGNGWITFISCLFVLLALSCQPKTKSTSTTETAKTITAKEILGNPDYRAISYGGYRQKSRDIQPTVEQLTEDMLLMAAAGIKLIRTYNVTRPHAHNVLRAIKSIKEKDPSFEMYVMLGAWIDCKNAWTDLEPDHNEESPENANEIARAVKLANEYPDIVKIIAVGNEAMVKWAAAYYVQPDVILKWVNHLQQLKEEGKLSSDLWITSSDNFASWGGGGSEYHVSALVELVGAVDFISLHTYPMHDTHYNPDFWFREEDETKDTLTIVDEAMDRALAYAQKQFRAVDQFADSIGYKDKILHIGETGWASHSDGFYGPEGSGACDQYKQGLYHQRIREWTDTAGISCFYFQAIDEPWKDAQNPNGSENHFGLFTVDGQAKYVIWDLVDQGKFEGLKRGGNKITKTFNGDKNELLKTVSLPPVKGE